MSAGYFTENRAIDNPIEVLQGILVAATAITAISGTFLTITMLNKGIGKSYVLPNIVHSASFFAGFITILLALPAMIDWPYLSGTLSDPKAIFDIMKSHPSVIQDVRLAITCFFIQMILFFTAFLLILIYNFVIIPTLKPDDLRD